MEKFMWPVRLQFLSGRRRDNVDIWPICIIKKEKIQQHNKTYLQEREGLLLSMGLWQDREIKSLPQQRHCSSACPRGNGRFPEIGSDSDTKQAERDPVSNLWVILPCWKCTSLLAAPWVISPQESRQS